MLFGQLCPDCSREADLQIKKGKLAGRTAILVHKAAGKVASKNGAQVIVGDLVKGN